MSNNHTDKTGEFVNSFENRRLYSAIQYTETQMALIIVSMTTVSFLITLSNLMVIYLFFRYKVLRTAQNYYILSLAFADIIVGLISMNFYTVYLMYGYWPLGRIACEMWLVTDYAACTVSTYTLVVISADRFSSTFFPIFYHKNQSKKYTLRINVGAWTLSFVLWAISILLYPLLVGRKVPVKECFVIFVLESKALSITLALLSFYIPCLLIAILYVALYYKIKSRKSVGANVDTNETQRKISSSSGIMNRIKKDTTEESNKTYTHTVAAGKKFKKGLKLRLIFLIVTAFTLFWLPYYITTAFSLITGSRVSQHFWRFCYICGWLNSLVNPLCYALGVPKFKECIRETFGLKKGRHNSYSLSSK